MVANVIHARNPTFGGEGSPDSSTSLRSTTANRMPVSPPGEYEVVSHMTSTRGSITTSLRNKYETIENEGPPEYSHLQHSHGGSLKRNFSTNSTGTGTMSTSNNRERLSKTSSLTGYKQELMFDSPEYMTVGLGKSNPTSSSQIEVDMSMDNTLGYSHINHEALEGKKATELEDDDSEAYPQVPSVFTQAANKPDMHQTNHQISLESRTTMAAHPSARRHHSATVNGVSGEDAVYTSIDPTGIKERNSYSFSIVSTDDQYVSEQGHVYHVLERSDELRGNPSSTANSNSSSPKFRIQDGDNRDKNTSGTVPPYCLVTKSPKQTRSKPKEAERNDKHSDSSQNSSEGATNESRAIPPYSQVDKSKKIKNRQPNSEDEEPENEENEHHYHILEQVDGQDSPDTHHYHVLEQSIDEKIEPTYEEEGGPIYHTIDHKA